MHQIEWVTNHLFETKRSTRVLTLNNHARWQWHVFMKFEHVKWANLSMSKWACPWNDLIFCVNFLLLPADDRPRSELETWCCSPPSPLWRNRITDSLATARLENSGIFSLKYQLYDYTKISETNISYPIPEEHSHNEAKCIFSLTFDLCLRSFSVRLLRTYTT